MMSTSSVSAKTPPRILPALDDSSRPYWTGGANGELLIAHCGSCRRFVHPAPEACPDCGGALASIAVSGNATLFTWTVAFQQFHPDVPTPFVIALVELDEQPGLRLITNIVSCEPDTLVAGMAVTVQFEQHGTVFVPVFAPATRPGPRLT
jgi:uncharacterized protein